MREIYPVIEEREGEDGEKRHAFKGGRGCIFHRRHGTQIRAASDHRVQRQTCNQAAGTQAIGGPPLSEENRPSIDPGRGRQPDYVDLPSRYIYIYSCLFSSSISLYIILLSITECGCRRTVDGGLLLVARKIERGM